MGRDQMRNLETFNVGTTKVNEFEYQHNQGELTEQLEHQPDQQNLQPETPTEAERIEQVMAEAHEKVEERKRRGKSSYTSAKSKPKKSTARKSVARKSATRKAAATTSAAKKSAAKRSTKKSAAKKSSAKRSAARKSAAKKSAKSVARKSAAKKSGSKKSGGKKSTKARKR
jgi:hypothetical protein